MRCDVTVVFDARHAVNLSVTVETSAQGAAAARDWFISTWVTLGCEPLRPSGKVLLLDKVLGWPTPTGYDTLSSNP